MTWNDQIICILLFLLLVTTVMGMSAFARRSTVHPEMIRKSIHVSMGLVTLGFPWWFSSIWPVVILLLASLGYFWALYNIPVWAGTAGRSIHAVGRRSLGEFYFILGVCIAVICARTDLEYYLAILILTFADAAAAITGIYTGRHIVKLPGGVKTIEGSIAFYIIALSVCWITLGTFGQHDITMRWIMTLNLALAATLAEVLTTRGMDNLAIPVVVLFMLYYGASNLTTIVLLILTVILLCCYRKAQATSRHRFAGAGKDECRTLAARYRSIASLS